MDSKHLGFTYGYKKSGYAFFAVLGILLLVLGYQNFGPTPNDSLSVHKNRVYKNDRPFYVKGIIFEGFLEPVAELEHCVAAGLDDASQFCARHLETRSYYFGRGKYRGKDAISLFKHHWKINTVRFNVSQSALDPKSTSFSREYIRELRQVVNRARAERLIVFLALFDHRWDDPSNSAHNYLRKKNPVTPLNTETSLRAALTLAKNFGQDRGVAIELLNEPFSPTIRRKGWELWLNGGEVEDGKFKGKYVGVNRIISAMRARGAKNLIGLQAIGASFHDFPGGVKDPLNQIFYSSHPFMAEGKEEMDWHSIFGVHAERFPFIMTAWGAHTNRIWCEIHGIERAEEYLQYLLSKRIGVIGYAADVPWSSILDYRVEENPSRPRGFAYQDGQPVCSKYDPESNRERDGAGGTLLQNFYLGKISPLENRPPVIKNVFIPGSIGLGNELKVIVYATDPERDVLSYRVRWGDGSDLENSPFKTTFSSENISTHVYKWLPKDREFFVTVIVRDQKGATSSQKIPIKVFKTTKE